MTLNSFIRELDKLGDSQISISTEAFRTEYRLDVVVNTKTGKQMLTVKRYLDAREKKTVNFPLFQEVMEELLRLIIEEIQKVKE